MLRKGAAQCTTSLDAGQSLAASRPPRPFCQAPALRTSYRLCTLYERVATIDVAARPRPESAANTCRLGRQDQQALTELMHQLPRPGLRRSPLCESPYRKGWAYALPPPVFTKDHLLVVVDIGSHREHGSRAVAQGVCDLGQAEKFEGKANDHDG